MTPFCDYLTVTFPPDDCPHLELNKLLLSGGFEVQHQPDFRKLLYRPSDGRGLVVVERSSRWSRVAASGAACSALRCTGSWHEYLSELGSQPHEVTRLDAALDMPVDGADVIDSLRQKHPSGRVALSRKAMPVTTLLSVRRDGRETGSYYVGRRSRARFTARVYDKAEEALQKRGECLPPTTRYEVTATSGSGVTLRDAAEPEAIFWHIASPAILAAPKGVPVWEPCAFIGWQTVKPEFDPAALLRRRVESLSELDVLCSVADELGPCGRDYLLRLLAQRLGVVEPAHKLG